MFIFRPLVKALALSTLIAAFPAYAEAPLPSARTPEEVGLSSAQLKRIEAVTQAHVDSGTVPGAQMLIARKGKIAWQARLGYRDQAAKDAIPADALFRIYSMTKPITSVVAMMLVEEGRLQVAEPVTKYLSEIGEMKVATEKPGEGKHVVELSPPARAMTVQDLLRHTSGLTYGEFGNSPVHTLYRDAKIGDRNLTNTQFVSALSKMPLRFSPGARFEYGRSTDVMGRVIEIIEGKSLGDVMAARVFGPLAMTDTAFGVPVNKLARGAAEDGSVLRHGAEGRVRGRRRGTGLDDGRLPEVRARAGQRRHLERQAAARSADRALDDGRSPRCHSGLRSRPGLRSWCRGAHQSG